MLFKLTSCPFWSNLLPPLYVTTLAHLLFCFQGSSLCLFLFLVCSVVKASPGALELVVFPVSPLPVYTPEQEDPAVCLFRSRKDQMEFSVFIWLDKVGRDTRTFVFSYSAGRERQSPVQKITVQSWSGVNWPAAACLRADWWGCLL